MRHCQIGCPAVMYGGVWFGLGREAGEAVDRAGWTLGLRELRVGTVWD